MTKSGIPKTIYYTWFGSKPIPKKFVKNIESWKKFLPDYKIVKINEDNFDVNCTSFTKNAYDKKIYAFVSDYARLKFLYENGGLYFDLDVQLIKNIDDILDKGPFMACEFDPSSKQETNLNYDIKISVNPGLGLAVDKNNQIIKDILEIYDKNGAQTDTTIVQNTTLALQNAGLKNTKGIQKINNIYIYPKEYFNPKSLYTGKIEISKNTRSIHYYSTTWINPAKRLFNKFIILSRRIFGNKFVSKVGSKKIFNNFWTK